MAVGNMHPLLFPSPSSPSSLPFLLSLPPNLCVLYVCKAAGEGTSRALDTNTTANNHTQQNELASEANGTHSSKGGEGMDTVTGVCAVRPAAASGHSDVDGVSETLESLDRERGEEGGEGNTVSAGDDKKGVATGSGVEETEGYQKVEFSALYYHSATGYYYDAVSFSFTNRSRKLLRKFLKKLLRFLILAVLKECRS